MSYSPDWLQLELKLMPSGKILVPTLSEDSLNKLMSKQLPYVGCVAFEQGSNHTKTKMKLGR